MFHVLTKNAMVVMDNAIFHKQSEGMRATKESGCQLEFFAPY